MPGKREDYINWDEYFMGTALLASLRCKDPSTQVGACLVNEELTILSVGYNGATYGYDDDELPWDSPGEATNDLKTTKNPYIAHAELNAIANCQGNKKGSTIYITLFPCNECAKLLIQSGIKKVVYLREYRYTETVEITKRLFDSAGVEYVPYNHDKTFSKEEVTEVSGQIQKMLKRLSK